MPITEAVNAVVVKMEESMKERLTRLGRDFSALRTGRANPMLLENVKVEYYGQQVPLKQVAAVSVPEARTLEIRPWDPSVLKDLEKALSKADLGAQPINDGKMIRLSMPAMNEERRKELVKVVKRMGEEAKVGLRTDRHDALEKVKKAEKGKEISQDELKLLEAKIQKVIDQYVRFVDETVAGKEKEITTV
ncbi:MAG TPA: ribosome recycling factor [Elusimicrobia bacterium]|nr:ribosome recycling factor [Elusimicrobiota bacterium]HBT61693.1 ribosome recycling factor [Elusimicrobiota bacterium]